MNKIIIGIDASRNRSGGAKAYLIGILSAFNPLAHDIQLIHVWAYKSLLDSIPDHPWLIKHNPKDLDRSLVRQLWWQAVKCSKEVVASKCDILFTTDASTVSNFKPMVVLSQDMLSYEPGVMKYFGISLARLRLLSILFIQNRAMRFATGVIFLTKYAGEVIQRSAGKLKNIKYIPHGIDQTFKRLGPKPVWQNSNDRPIKCLYVSNTALYKHQWIVVRAVALLRKQGYNLQLTLVGGGEGKAQQLLENEMRATDPNKIFCTQTEFVDQNKLPEFLLNSDIFIFASSCENMPVTLLEAMAAGLPIACSNRGPMPEVLEDAGVYFDPENPESIADAIKQIITSLELRNRIAIRSKALSNQYSWERCASETFDFITETYRNILRT